VFSRSVPLKLALIDNPIRHSEADLERLTYAEKQGINSETKVCELSGLQSDSLEFVFTIFLSNCLKIY
jgi:hypothetical protein